MFIESLEGRMLMSGSPVNPQIAADRLVVQVDLFKFRSNICAGTASMIRNFQTLKTDGLWKDAILSPLFTQLHSDVTQMRQQLISDRLTEAKNVINDQFAIIDELRLIVKDQGNSSELQADRATLLSDRIQLQDDEIAGLDSRITTRQNDYTTIFNDISNINTAASTDTSASPELLAAVETFTADRATFLNTLSSDLQNIMSARNQLANDLTALE